MNSSIVTQHWDPHFIERSPMFEPLRSAAAELPEARWPTIDDLQRRIAARAQPIRTGNGAALAFVAQGPRPRRLEDRYEARIFLKGEVQVRSGNWHDLLNALAWLTFPNAKAALNTRHYQALLVQRAAGTLNRGPLQDALTLFDEGGVVVAAASSDLLDRIRAFAWKSLFWRERSRVRSEMWFVLFGHALFEKALAPFSGITGRGILLEVGAEFLSAPLAARIEQLDLLVAERLLDAASLRSTRELAPVPILGVPGWCVENEHEGYYEDASYFRPGRRV